LSLNVDEIDLSTFNPNDWTSETFTSPSIVETEVVSVTKHVRDTAVRINGDVFSQSHKILTRKDGIVQFVLSNLIDGSFEVWNYTEQNWVSVTEFETISYIDKVYSINCEPYDMFFTNNMLVYDSDSNIQS